MAKIPLGKLDPEAIGMLEVSRLPMEVVAAFRSLGDLTGLVSDGAVRDIDHSRGIGYPVWSSSVSPITGKWRIETVAVNKPVRIAGVAVHPGDLVVADEVGVCFIPFARAAEVLEVARRLERAERERLEKLSHGVPLAEFAALPRKD